MNTRWILAISVALLGATLAVVPAVRADQLWLRQGTSGYSGCTDTWLDEDGQTENNGNATLIQVYDVSDDPDESGLIRFNLPGLFPTGPIEINYATLSLRLDERRLITGDEFCEIGAYRVMPTRDWAELQATWLVFKGTSYWGTPGCESSADRNLTPDDTVVFTATSSEGLMYSWDVTSSVTQWVENSVGNAGWLLRVTSSTSGGNEGCNFDSSEALIEGARPSLLIDYDVVPEPATVGLVGVGLALLLRQRKRR